MHNSYSTRIWLALAIQACIVCAFITPVGTYASQPKNFPDAPVEKAEYKFGVQNISLNGNTITFTIPENAHSHQKKGDSVRLSGIYTLDKNPEKECPVVDSHDVSKKVVKYNPIGGKARVVATFDDPAAAQRVAKNGCLLINDED